MGITVQSRGRAGEILVTDERADGALVYLICRPWDDPPGNGILVGPGEPPEEDKELHGTFPLFAERAEPPFRITIDTSRLPAGPLQFRSEDFVEMARITTDQGADHVTLDERNAEKWGLIGEQLHG